MSYPEPDLGSTQVGILKKLSTVDSMPFQEEKLQRALEKLYQKGYVNFFSLKEQKHWAITKQGIKALADRAAS